MQRTICIAILLAAAGGAQAEGLTIKPGLWETTTTMTNPFGGGEQTNTTEECVEEDHFDPESMMQDRNDVSGNTLNFGMSCDMEGAKSTVTGTFTSEGDAGSGNMNMNIDAGGMQMEMKMSWTSKRLGDC